MASMASSFHRSRYLYKMKYPFQIMRKYTYSSMTNGNTSHQRTIKDFYNDSTIFITGGTGFVGKVLVEKLLRSCENIKEINLLIRPKKGQLSQSRLQDYLNEQVFDRVRREFPGALKKITAISGDVTKHNLGLDDFNRQKLIDNVNIVFNSAATIKFNEPLTNAININTLGTDRVMDLCSKMVQLKSVVHVSTAYSNPTESLSSTFKEKIYPFETRDKEYLLKCTSDCIPDEFKESFPNTYVLSKSLAEEIVSSYSKNFPVSIVRPSAVSASIEEPFIGFVDNVHAINGISFAVSQGLARVMVCDKNCLIDLIPVDVVAKQMIAAAWRTGTGINQDIQVYNCASGSTNPLSYGELAYYLKKWSRKYPSERTILYPMLFLTNPYLYSIFGFLLNKLPAIYWDMFLKLKGSKPIVLKNTNKFFAFIDIIDYFLTRTFHFGDENSKKLSKLVAAAKDGKEFSYDLNSLNWDTYIRNYILGLRRYVLREHDSSIPEARKKLYMLLLKQTIIPSIFATVVTGVMLQFRNF